MRPSSIEEQLTATINSLQAALADAKKADLGNNAAGTRVRAVAKNAKDALTSLRADVLLLRKAD